MAKEEIIQYMQFRLSPLCFHKSTAAEASEKIFMWERVLTPILWWSKRIISLKILLSTCNIGFTSQVWMLEYEMRPLSRALS